MTTVCYKDGILAFDSRISDGEMHYGWTNKGRITNKYIMAACGSLEDMEAAMDWIEHTDGKISEKEKYGLHEREVDCEVIVVDTQGKVKFFGQRLYPTTLDALYYAIGSGAPYAMGAMAVGKSAKEAVHAAAKHDLATGGYVRQLKITNIGARPKVNRTTKKKAKK